MLAPEPTWPVGAPPRPYFERVYDEDATNRSVQNKRVYLQWVEQFYQGVDLYPLGWSELERALLAELDGPLREQAAPRLDRLGRKVGADWAKHNTLRLVTNAMLLVWSQVIQEAVDSGLILTALVVIEEDVDALLDGRLPPEAIGVERYASWLPEDS